MDNDSDGALFEISGMAPDRPETGCIKVTYHGTGAGPTSFVKLYGSTTATTGLDQYLNLKVTRGRYDPSEPGFDSCANFVADSANYFDQGPGVLYNGTLQGYGDSYTSGAIIDPSECATPPCAPEEWVNPESHVYRFEITLQDTNEAQGLTAAQVFTWEARDIL